MRLAGTVCLARPPPTTIPPTNGEGLTRTRGGLKRLRSASTGRSTRSGPGRHDLGQGRNERHLEARCAGVELEGSDDLARAHDWLEQADAGPDAPLALQLDALAEAATWCRVRPSADFWGELSDFVDFEDRRINVQRCFRVPVVQNEDGCVGSGIDGGTTHGADSASVCHVGDPADDSRSRRAPLVGSLFAIPGSRRRVAVPSAPRYPRRRAGPRQDRTGPARVVAPPGVPRGADRRHAAVRPARLGRGGPRLAGRRPCSRGRTGDLPSALGRWGHPDDLGAAARAPP